MASVNDLITTVNLRLNDAGDTVWTAAEKRDAVVTSLRAMYPQWFALQFGTLTAAAGTEQAPPAGATNIYAVYRSTESSTRARPLRNWREGAGTLFIPQNNLAGDTLTVCWTTGFDAGATDNDPVTGPLPPQAQEPALLLAQIALLERILDDRTKQNTYFALQLREGATEQDLSLTLDTLYAKLDRLTKAAIPLPARQG